MQENTCMDGKWKKCIVFKSGKLTKPRETLNTVVLFVLFYADIVVICVTE